MNMPAQNNDQESQTEKGILVIHEDPFHREMIALSLTRNGYVGLFVVESAEKGLEVLQTVKPALVVLSDGILETDGIGAGHRIREALGNAAKLVVLGDGHNRDSKEKAKQINADDFAERSPDSFSHYAHLLRSIKGLIR